MASPRPSGFGNADWIDTFGDLAQLSVDERALLANSCAIVDVAAGKRIFEPGRSPEHFLLLLDGTVRVQQISEAGREIVMYRVAAGESCMLTTACLLGHHDYSAEAVAETDLRAVAIPRGTFDDLMGRSATFRRFVFAAFTARITNLFRLVEEVAFARMDIRLAHKLIELAHGEASIAVTQQQLAVELGTAREVVGRVLGELQRRGWVTASRGHIAISDRPALEALARQI